MIHSLYDRWSGFSLKTKLLLSYILVAMLPMASFGYYIIAASEAYVTTNAETALHTMVQRSKELTSQKIEHIETIMSMCAYNQGLQPVYRNQFANSFEQYAGVDRLESFYAIIFATNDRSLKELCFYSFRELDGTSIFLNDKKAALQRHWYPAAAAHLGQGGIHWIIDNQHCFAFVWLYDYGKKTPPLGLVYCEMNLPELLSQNISLNWPTWNLRITSPAGEFNHSVGAPDTLRQALWKPFRYTLENGWNFEFQAAIEGELNSSSSLFIIGTVIVAALTLLMMPVIMKISRSMVSGIQSLTAWVHAVQSGKMDASLRLNQRDEIGTLGQAFQAMLKQINTMMVEIREKERRHLDLELRALRAQIDPHFLHNTLSYMNWCAIKNGDEEMSSIIGHLAAFYRTCLNGGRDFITVEQEVNNAMAYLEIQKALHQHTFTASFHIAQEVRHQKMLCFLLQPLAENAVIHGMDQKSAADSDGRIVISASLADGFLLITMEDNGPGMPPNLMQQGGVNLPVSEKYGIRYVVRRIQLEYGEAANLSFSSLQPSGTRAILRLPVKS